MRSASSMPNGDLICQCTAGMPVFVADVMRAAVQDGLQLYGPDNLHDGDVVITNYAGTIGQHLNNVTMYTPIYAPQRPVLIGFMVVVMHWIDVGGRDVGSIVQIRHRHLPGRHPVPHRQAALARRAGARNVPDDRAQHPLPGRDDGRHQLADRRLPDGPRQRRRAGRALRHRHVPRRARRRSGTSPRRQRARRSAPFPMAPTRPRPCSTTTGSIPARFPARSR